MGNNVTSGLVCLHQLSRPSGNVPEPLRPAGYGDCCSCQASSENRRCLGYKPVGLYFFNIEEPFDQWVETVEIKADPLAIVGVTV